MFQRVHQLIVVFIAKAEAKELSLLLNFLVKRNHFPAPGGQQVLKARRRGKWQGAPCGTATNGDGRE